MATNTQKCTYIITRQKEEKQCSRKSTKGTLCTQHYNMGKSQGEPESCDEDDSVVSTPVRNIHNYTPGRCSTPPTSVARSSIGELGSLLKDLHVRDDYDHSGDKPLKLKRVNTAQSAISYGPRDPVLRQLNQFMPRAIHPSVHEYITLALEARLRKDERRAYVYILHAIPGRERHSSASADENIDTDRIILKVGSSIDVSARITRLSSECKYHKYKRLEAFPDIGPIELSYKVEELVHATLKNWAYRSPLKCPCKKEHKEFFEVEQKELKAVYRCVKHWADVVTKNKDKLWVKKQTDQLPDLANLHI
ncbi:hypothetical protein BGW36DRAFT_451108 [Talaromyces proteolyticus]|uniref:Bacteriophage T5 Orf172 DNA-binding domain-containing protein n=1 Tax=Talaromyces proteolyticus TaxID=1131652 RepID=A0AAD4PV35_9EURO|nr:uncharacterized protein BGW36DRAFT_451108 [Talaromyces proteolyticus]KAH8696050.1 hypothetical protein BGW36DRAFT_451108 [Talaromyces proteolyticus]